MYKNIKTPDGKDGAALSFHAAALVLEIKKYSGGVLIAAVASANGAGRHVCVDILHVRNGESGPCHGARDIERNSRARGAAHYSHPS